METRNTILAFVLAIIVLVGWQYMFELPQQKQMQMERANQQQQSAPSSVGQLPSSSADVSALMDPVQPKATAELSRAEILAQDQERVYFENRYVKGSISTIGGKIDDLTLLKYKETLDEDSKNIVLLSPAGSDTAYFANTGWTASGQHNIQFPNPQTKWTVVEKSNSSIILEWTNPNGQTFKRTYTLDEKYLVTVQDTVVNNSNQALRLFPYALVNRKNTPETSGIFILHEGPIGVVNGEGLVEYDYDDLQSETYKHQTKSGWVGITDKYWLTSLIPPQHDLVKASFSHYVNGANHHYQVGYLGTEHLLNPNQEVSYEHKVFAGAKQLDVLESYQEKYQIENFELAVDFGWFYFLTKPLFIALKWINGFVGNFGFSILILTVLVKLAFFPLANKSYVAMSKMRLLQPELVKLRERYQDDRMKLNQEMMALYKKEKVNPAAGCLPILIQIPVFFALYKVLFVAIDLRQAPFFGWIQDLSMADPTSLFNLFGLLPYDVPGFLTIGVWPVIMGLSMFLQQKLNPQPADPVQAKVFMFLPIFFTYILASFPAGLVIYWAWNNILSMIQQWVIMQQTSLKTRTNNA